jgi:hypothetical protein
LRGCLHGRVPNDLHSNAEADGVFGVVLALEFAVSPEANPDRSRGEQLPRLDVGKPQPDPKRDEQHPPGKFVSDEHAADCSRFLQEVKESIQRRYELGLGRDR